MITITNGIEKMTIRKEMTKKVKRGVRVSPNKYYCNIELLLEGRFNKFQRIIKKLPPDSGDELKSYHNLNARIKNEILLSNDDYIEVKRLYDNMILDDEIRKNELILIAATLFAYECYKNYYLEELYQVPSKAIFDEIVMCLDEYREIKNYKNEIYNKARKILKDRYGIKDLIVN